MKDLRQYLEAVNIRPHSIYKEDRAWVVAFRSDDPQINLFHATGLTLVETPYTLNDYTIFRVKNA